LAVEDVQSREGEALMDNSESKRSPLPLAHFSVLVRRFFSMSFYQTEAIDTSWVKMILRPNEFDLWMRQSSYDQRHTIKVARDVENRLSRSAYASDSVWLATALLHDVGKVESDLEKWTRVVATTLGRMISVRTARRWATIEQSYRMRIGKYLIHGEIGAGMVRRAGGREAIALWSEVHQGYRSMKALPIPPIVLKALIASDSV
jgi:hypothetical protein